MNTHTRRSGLRFLVVDGCRDAADSLALLAQMCGHEAHAAYDGLAGLDAALRLRPDVVVLDVVMPKLGGWALAERLRARAEFRRTLLVAVTGYGRDADRARSRAAGIDRHLVKPLDDAELGWLLAGGGRRPSCRPLPVCLDPAY